MSASSQFATLVMEAGGPPREIVIESLREIPRGWVFRVVEHKAARDADALFRQREGRAPWVVYVFGCQRWYASHPQPGVTPDPLG